MENRSNGISRAIYKCRNCIKSSKILLKGELINIKGPLLTKDIEKTIIELNTLNGEEKNEEYVGQTTQ